MRSSGRRSPIAFPPSKHCASGAPGPAQAAPSAPSAASGVAASRSASIAAAIAKQLAPSGRSAKIAALFKAGFYGLRLKALEAGTAVVRWYYLPHGAKLGGKGKHAPVLVASGTVKFRSAGTATVKLRLTLTGRRLLAHARQLRLTATCVFTPVGSAIWTGPCWPESSATAAWPSSTAWSAGSSSCRA